MKKLMVMPLLAPVLSFCVFVGPVLSQSGQGGAPHVGDAVAARQVAGNLLTGVRLLLDFAYGKEA